MGSVHIIDGHEAELQGPHSIEELRSEVVEALRGKAGNKLRKFMTSTERAMERFGADSSEYQELVHNAWVTHVAGLEDVGDRRTGWVTGSTRKDGSHGSMRHK